MVWNILAIILTSLLSIPILIVYSLHVYDKVSEKYDSETDKKESNIRLYFESGYSITLM